MPAMKAAREARKIAFFRNSRLIIKERYESGRRVTDAVSAGHDVAPTVAVQDAAAAANVPVEGAAAATVAVVGAVVADCDVIKRVSGYTTKLDSSDGGLDPVATPNNATGRRATARGQSQRVTKNR